MPASLIDWSTIDHVLLDMDGTVLDLAYDNHFWYELVPRRYAQLHGLSFEEANARLDPEFKAVLGTLNWYCLDYWSRFTGLDIIAMKAEVKHRIAALPGSEHFLQAVRGSGRDLWLATNAHHGSWKLKLAETGFGQYFDQVHCSHDFGAPKEDARFWPALRERHPFDPARTLFADDNLSVLRAADAYGIAQVVAIRHPDSTGPKRVIEDFPSVDRLSELLPIV
jgi:putative hydrolase of the HAD superfamily